MRIYIDCTDTYNTGMNTGIQRVVRNFVKHTMVLGSSLGVDCQPVIFRNGAILPLENLDDTSLHQPRHTLRGYLNRAYLAVARRIAAILPFPTLQRFLLAHRSQFGLAWMLFLPLQLVSWLRSQGKSDQPPPKAIEAFLGKDDILFLADASWSGDVFGILEKVKANGARVVFFVQDIIPLTHPQFCHPVHIERFREWFGQVIQIADFLIYSSHFTQQSIADYLDQRPSARLPTSAVVYLGHDFGALPTGGIRHGKLLRTLTKSSASFLCVGTLEPRKNLGILIDAFEALWNDGHDVSLIFIGRAGWLCDDLLLRIRHHPERGRQLLWFDDVGDTDLALAYRQASALIFPSIVEGFGLPLVEALGQGLPVIASDIPVFREIAGDHGRYFPPADAQALAGAVKAHLAASSDTCSSPFRWPTWEESARQLLTTLQTFAGGQSGRG